MRVFYLLLGWLPTYLSSELHIDLLHSFLYTGVPWLLATVADVAVGGWLVDSLIHRGWDSSRVRQTVLIGGTSLGLGIIGAANTRPMPAESRPLAFSQTGKNGIWMPAMTK